MPTPLHKGGEKRERAMSKPSSGASTWNLQKVRQSLSDSNLRGPRRCNHLLVLSQGSCLNQFGVTQFPGPFIYQNDLPLVRQSVYNVESRRRNGTLPNLLNLQHHHQILPQIHHNLSLPSHRKPSKMFLRQSSPLWMRGAEAQPQRDCHI
jgi:hypothetical protein